MVMYQLGSLHLWFLFGLGQCEALTGSQRIKEKKSENVYYTHPTSLPNQFSLSTLQPLVR